MSRKIDINTRNRNSISDEESLGILRLDSLKVFGDISTKGNGSINNGRISERLNLERKKALETLKKSPKLDNFKKPQSISNKENIKSGSAAIFNSTPKLDHTNYVPYKHPESINISDLVSDETINLETSSCPPSAAKESKISFEPAEITGRSTHYNTDLKKTAKNPLTSTRLSVNDILASSFAPKARNLRDSLPSGAESSLELARGNGYTNSGASSSFTSYNASRSLPRTADMSLSKVSSLSYSDVLFSSFPQSQGGGAGANDSAFSAEDFEPGELMQSKLLMDEISWAQEYAAIPTAALSEQAKAKATRDSIMMSNGFDTSNGSNSTMARDPNFSVGNFFNMRSENLWNMVPSKSPRKSRAPIALVDPDNASMNTINSSKMSDSATPKIDNRTYSKMGAAGNSNTRESNNNQLDKHDSKDSGTDNSYMLSMSAIDRALCNMDIQTDDSDIGVINQFLLHGKKSKLCPNPANRAAAQSLGSNIKQQAVANVDIMVELIAENKENLDPEVMRGAHADTLSFSESLLNSTDMKQLQRSINEPRSPLSPIRIDNPRLHITDADLGDIDDWPSTPVKSPNRIVRRTKSPRDTTPNEQSLEMTLTAEKTPVHKHSPQTNSAPQSQAKSHCSTRLEGENKTDADLDFGISPNLSKSNSKKSVKSAINNAYMINSDCGGDRASRHSSPTPFNVSPMSSPRNCMSVQASSQVSSPSGSYRSTQMDCTTNSERRYLSANDGVRKTVSSPVTSESANGKSFCSACYCSSAGVAPMRTASSTSVRSTDGAGVKGGAARSNSRCSNNSEFSHRDGKVIPLKVTNMELSWNNSKLRTDVQKSMQVKNISGKRLVIRVEAHGPGFQIVNKQSNTITLQSLECRTITINFCPTVIGVAIGTLSFYSPHNTTSSNASFLDIPLFGYGGHCSIVVQNILQGPVGAGFMTMGDLCELSRPLERTFTIQNKGPLKAFAIVCMDSMGLTMRRLCDAIEVRPQSVLIAPGKAATIRMTFRPRRDDIKKIIQKKLPVLTLANMRIISGTEANRQRMRRLVARMSAVERAKIASNTLDKLWVKFQGEVEMHELEALQEKPEVAMDLLTAMRIHEVAITLNHDFLDDTIDSSSMYPDGDDTVLFRTVCAAPSPTPSNMLEPVNEMYDEYATAEGDEDERAVSSTREGAWSVNPTSIEFDFHAERRTERVSFLIRNSFKSRQYFEVVCNRKNLLRFTPNEGYVEPEGGQIEVEVNTSLMRPPERMSNEPILILVSMENERITLPVNIPNDNYAQEHLR